MQQSFETSNTPDLQDEKISISIRLFFAQKCNLNATKVLQIKSADVFSNSAKSVPVFRDVHSLCVFQPRVSASNYACNHFKLSLLVLKRTNATANVHTTFFCSDRFSDWFGCGCVYTQVYHRRLLRHVGFLRHRDVARVKVWVAKERRFI